MRKDKMKQVLREEKFTKFETINDANFKNSIEYPLKMPITR